MNRFILLIVVLVLSGCSHIYGDKGIIKDRDSDYLKARTVPPLRIPPGYSSSKMSAHYPIGDRNYPAGLEKVDLTPPEIQPASQSHNIVHSERPVPKPIIATSEHKQRYLTDAVQHPEYIAESFVPSKKTTTATEKTPEPVQQAENTPPAKKKKYIADYFR